MHWHWQNLNEKAADRKGAPYRGRCWWHLKAGVIGFEWNLWSRYCGIGFSIEEYDLTLRFCLPPFAFYLSIESREWLRRIQPMELSKYIHPPTMLPVGRECDISMYDWTVRLNPWSKTSEWVKADPWWVRGVSFDIPDFFLGKQKFSQRELSVTKTVIPMPEKSYDATVTLSEDTWKRPRWFPVRMIRANVSSPEGIPFPGKGENSWDCGQDATFSLYCPANTVEEAVASMVRSVLKDRRRYGGSVNWKPEATKEPA